MQWSFALALASLVGLHGSLACFKPDDIAAECEALQSASCKCKIHKKEVKNMQGVCCNISHSDDLENQLACAGFGTDMTGYQISLFITNVNTSRFDLSVVARLKDLINLSIVNSNISELYGKLSADKLTCLNLSDSSLRVIEPNAFTEAPRISMMDLSRNFILLLPDLSKQQDKLRLDISNNTMIRCKSLLNYNMRSFNYVNKDKTTCLTAKDGCETCQWIEIVAIPYEVIEKTKELSLACLKIADGTCNCTVERFKPLTENNFTYESKIDCSGKQLKKLPEIPWNTKILNISNNFITSFEGISSSRYESVVELYADNNNINANGTKFLEGSPFLDNFVLLSLKGNNIERLQAYMLSHLFDRNLGTKLYLGKNPIECDCDTASKVKIWITKEHIPDYEELWCKNIHTKLIYLEPSSVCFTPTNWTDYIHYIIGLEIVTFIVLIGKVFYDYYVFKTAGYLPWPASKMPKLPCDWCFE